MFKNLLSILCCGVFLFLILMISGYIWEWRKQTIENTRLLNVLLQEQRPIVTVTGHSATVIGTKDEVLLVEEPK